MLKLSKDRSSEMLFSKTIRDLDGIIPVREFKTRKYLGLPTPSYGFKEKGEWLFFPDFERTDYCITKSRGEEEPILDSSESGLSWLTLNHYGAVILCSKALLITDIDEKDPSILKTIETVMSPWFTVVYETLSGYRVLSTRPTDYYEGLGELEIVLNRVNSDPKYVDMMSVQRYGRARVTPKPWRYQPSEPASVCRLAALFGTRSTVSEEQDLAFYVHDVLAKVYLSWTSNLS